MNIVAETKDRVQRAGLNKWFKNGYKGTLEYATGVGKTRCGIIAASYFARLTDFKCRIIILTPTETIRDKAWREEFAKWKEKDVFNLCVETICIQSAYKLAGNTYDLVIADEVHNYITPEYFNFFVNNTCKRILGLSASIDESKIDLLDTIAPIVDTIDTNDALKLGLVSAFKIYNLGISLTAEEQEEYDRADATFKRIFPLFRDLNDMFECLKNKSRMNAIAARIGLPYAAVAGYPGQCAKAMRTRKQIIYDAINKLVAVKEISDAFPNRLAIIFSETTEFTDRVTEELGDSCVSFHSKIGKKQRTSNLKRLQDGRTKVNRISAARALNEGVNIPKCSLAIVAAGNSKSKDWVQRLGRSIRWQEDKQAVIIRLYVKDSQEERWLRRSQSGYEVKFVDTLNEILKFENEERTQEIQFN